MTTHSDGIATAMRSDSSASSSSSATATSRTGQDSSTSLDRITATLAPLCENLDQRELKLLLTSYSHVSCELEIHRFAQTWSSGPLRSLGPVERWLARARPAPERPTGRSSRGLSPDEVERRLDAIRRNIEGATVFGERFLSPEEVEQNLDFHRERFEARR